MLPVRHARETSGLRGVGLRRQRVWVGQTGGEAPSRTPAVHHVHPLHWGSSHEHMGRAHGGRMHAELRGGSGASRLRGGG